MGVAKHTVDLRKVLVNLSEALLDNREPLLTTTRLGRKDRKTGTPLQIRPGAGGPRLGDHAMHPSERACI